MLGFSTSTQRSQARPSPQNASMPRISAMHTPVCRHTRWTCPLFRLSTKKQQQVVGIASFAITSLIAPQRPRGESMGQKALLREALVSSRQKLVMRLMMRVVRKRLQDLAAVEPGERSCTLRARP